MAVKFFRCYNCKDDKGMPGRDFIADAALPICPNCTLDGRPGNLHAGNIVALRTVHYDPRHAVVKNRGRNTPVCGSPRTAATCMTGDPNAVNCLACMNTETFKTEKAEYNAGADEFEQSAFLEEKNFAVTVNETDAAYVKLEG